MAEVTRVPLKPLSKGSLLMLLVGIRVAVVWIAGAIALGLGAVVAAMIHPILSGVVMVFGMIALVLLIPAYVLYPSVHHFADRGLN
mgnify:CR=1 FL=1